jgi:hypothetical protein
VDKEEETIKATARMGMVLDDFRGMPIIIILAKTIQRKSGKTIPTVMGIKNCLRFVKVTSAII